MSTIQSLWKNFRLGLLILAFIVTSFYLAVITPWARYFGHPPTYAATIAEGQPIVDAIYRFKAERGLWPQYLDELAPAYLPKAPRPAWYYRVLTGGPSLAILPGGAGETAGPGGDPTKVGFDFDPASPSWRVIGYDEDRVLKREAPPGPTTLPAAKIIANELAELDHRIHADHGYMGHWRAKASLLRSLHRTDDAKATILAAKAADANHYWPRLAEAALDLEAAASAPATRAAQRESLPTSVKAFEPWARQEPTMTRLYYAALLYRMAGMDKQALKIIEEAAALPPATSGDDFEKPAFYLWDMTRFALEQKQYDLVLRLTGAWEKMQSDGRAAENSYLPLRAAAKLALGDFAGAQSDMDALAKTHSPTWAEHLDPLRGAIRRKDRGYVYDPGKNPPPFQVFALPE